MKSDMSLISFKSEIDDLSFVSIQAEDIELSPLTMEAEMELPPFSSKGKVDDICFPLDDSDDDEFEDEDTEENTFSDEDENTNEGDDETELLSMIVQAPSSNLRRSTSSDLLNDLLGGCDEDAKRCAKISIKEIVIPTRKVQRIVSDESFSRPDCNIVTPSRRQPSRNSRPCPTSPVPTFTQEEFPQPNLVEQSPRPSWEQQEDRHHPSYEIPCSTWTSNEDYQQHPGAVIEPNTTSWDCGSSSNQHMGDYCDYVPPTTHVRRFAPPRRVSDCSAEYEQQQQQSSVCDGSEASGLDEQYEVTLQNLIESMKQSNETREILKRHPFEGVNFFTSPKCQELEEDREELFHAMNNQAMMVMQY